MGTPTQRSGATRCLLAAALFGASAPAASVLVADGAPVALAGLLYLGAAAAVLPVVIAQGAHVRDLLSNWRALAAAVAFGGALGPALLVVGLTHTTAATASIMLNAEMVATVVLASLFFREHIELPVGLGATLVTLAAVVAAWQPGTGLDVGALLVLAACVCWGIDNCVTAGIDRVTPETVVLCKGLVAGGANLVLGLFVLGESMAPSPQMLGAALGVGALGYGLSITLWVRGAQALGAARAQVVFAVGPFFGAAVAWGILGETLTLPMAAATALAACGVGISVISRHEHRHVHEPSWHRHEHSHPDEHHEHHERHDAEHVGFTGRHEHLHQHERRLVHSHRHLPDLHHRHDHPE